MQKIQDWKELRGAHHHSPALNAAHPLCGTPEAGWKLALQVTVPCASLIRRALRTEYGAALNMPLRPIVDQAT
jgi:hypothetical protein